MCTCSSLFLQHFFFSFLYLELLKKGKQMEFCTWSTQRQKGKENYRDRGVNISEKSAKSVIDRQ